MIKKLLGIVVLGLLWCNVGIAIEIKNFYLSCSGTQKIVGGYNTSETKNFFQDYKLQVYTLDSGKKYIGSIKIVNTGSWYLRPIFRWTISNMPEDHKAYFDNENFETIRLTSKNSSGDEAMLNVHRETLTLPTGRLSVYLEVTGNESGWRWIVNINANCQGHDKLYAYLKDTPSVPNIDDKEILAASSGTGFFVSKKGHIVTNFHVIENCDSIKVNFKGEEINSEIFAVDKKNDLAIIQTTTNPLKVFPVSNKDVILLQDVIVAGYPLGKNLSTAIKMHKGSVTALAGYEDNYSNFQTDATINQGNSGGPIIDKNGNVVGIAVATWVEEGVQGIHFGIKSSVLKTFANSKDLNFLQPNRREISKEKLGELISEATTYLECWMTGAKIKKMIAAGNSNKAIYSKFK